MLQKLVVVKNQETGIYSCYIATIIPSEENATKNSSKIDKTFYGADPDSKFSGTVVYSTVTTNYTISVEKYADGTMVQQKSLYYASANLNEYLNEMSHLLCAGRIKRNVRTMTKNGEYGGGGSIQLPEVVIVAPAPPPPPPPSLPPPPPPPAEYPSYPPGSYPPGFISNLAEERRRKSSPSESASGVSRRLAIVSRRLLISPADFWMRRSRKFSTVQSGRRSDFELYAMIERIAPEVIAEGRPIYKGVSANVDFYSGFVYSMLDIPTELYTPMFAIARIVGWSAHCYCYFIMSGDRRCNLSKS